MAGHELAERRKWVGLVAAACLLGAGGLSLWVETPLGNPTVGVLVRIGVVLGALWLALPRRGEHFVWSKALYPGIAIIIAFAILRRAAWWLVPLAGVVGLLLVILRPKQPGRRG
jgi:hypothetical protein